MASPGDSDPAPAGTQSPSRGFSRDFMLRMRQSSRSNPAAAAQNGTGGVEALRSSLPELQVQPRRESDDSEDAPFEVIGRYERAQSFGSASDTAVGDTPLSSSAPAATEGPEGRKFSMDYLRSFAARHHEKPNDLNLSVIEQARLKPRAASLGASPASGGRSQSGSRRNPALFMQPVELARSENRWSRSEAKSTKERVLRTVLGCLNKLTPDNFERIGDQIIGTVKEVLTKKMLGKIADTVFDKAVMEVHFSAMYADFCALMIQRLGEVSAPTGEDSSHSQIFHQLLLAKSQREFERLLLAADPSRAPAGGEAEEESKEQGGDDATEEGEISPVKRRLSENLAIADTALEDVKTRKRLFGNMTFVAHLQKRGLIVDSITQYILDEMLLMGRDRVPPEEHVEAAVTLVFSVGSNMDAWDQDKVKGYFSRMRSLAEMRGKLPSRMCFMLMDAVEFFEHLRLQLTQPAGVGLTHVSLCLFDMSCFLADVCCMVSHFLLQSNWELRDNKKVSGPKRLEDVHAEAEEERRQQEALFRGPFTPKRRGRSSFVRNERASSRSLPSSPKTPRQRGLTTSPLPERAASSRDGSPVPPRFQKAPALTKERADKIARAVVDEAFAGIDFCEATAAVSETCGRSAENAELLGRSFGMIGLERCVESKSNDHAVTFAKLLHSILSRKVVLLEHLTPGYVEFLEFFDDIQIDVPFARTRFEVFLGTALPLGAFALEDLAKLPPMTLDSGTILSVAVRGVSLALGAEDATWTPDAPSLRGALRKLAPAGKDADEAIAGELACDGNSAAAAFFAAP